MVVVPGAAPFTINSPSYPAPTTPSAPSGIASNAWNNIAAPWGDGAIGALWGLEKQAAAFAFGGPVGLAYYQTTQLISAAKTAIQNPAQAVSSRS